MPFEEVLFILQILFPIQTFNINIDLYQSLITHKTFKEYEIWKK